MTYIQSLYGQHMVKMQFLLSKFEPLSPWKPFKVFTIELPFYIVIKHVKNYIYPITS